MLSPSSELSSFRNNLWGRGIKRHLLRLSVVLVVLALIGTGSLALAGETYWATPAKVNRPGNEL